MTAYLADACALIVFYTNAPQLTRRVRELFEDEASDIIVAATTI